MEKKTILVVEDEKAIADILVFNLQREGYDTIVAYDGTEGLRHALEDAPDPDPARRDAAWHGRLRGLQACTRKIPQHADHHADRARGGDRQGHGA